MKPKLVPGAHDSRKHPSNALRINDLITVAEAMALVNEAITNYHHRMHTPWYVKLWRKVKR